MASAEYIAAMDRIDSAVLFPGGLFDLYDLIISRVLVRRARLYPHADLRDQPETWLLLEQLADVAERERGDPACMRMAIRQILDSYTQSPDGGTAA
jgi:hypothetical protein